MRIVLVILGVILAIPALLCLALLASGTISLSSLPMILNVATGWGAEAPDEATVAQRFALPSGFAVSLYAEEVSGARFLALTSRGDLLVSRPHKGDVVLLRADRDGDGKADGMETLLSALNRPHGIDLFDDWLYVAESDRVGRIRFDAQAGAVRGDYTPIVEGLTDNGNHWSKSLKIGPDEKIYLAQGSTCNICEEEDPRRATMMRFELDGSAAAIIANGLRNSVGFDWAPWDQGLYATDNGRDLLGDNFPPCELNLVEAGRFYGWPYFNGNNIPDPDMGADAPATAQAPTAPVHAFPAHNAPLGITFLGAKSWPQEYQRSALVALHGSWNRSQPDGYKVVSLHWSAQGIEQRDFFSGFNVAGDIIGRPVDIVQAEDGSAYISDDYAGVIYRVAYQGEEHIDNAVLLPTPGEVSELPPAWLDGADLPALWGEGEALYQANACAECHAQGDSPVLLSGLSKRMSYSGVEKAMREPPSPMPVYPFSDGELRALSIFLLHTPEGRAATDRGP